MKKHLQEYITEGSSEHMRGLRLLIEYFCAAEQFQHLERSEIPIVSIFGSARTKPDSLPNKWAYQVAANLYRADFAVITGGSHGVMGAANHGIADAIAEDLMEKINATSLTDVLNSDLYKDTLKRYSLGLNISLPFESGANPWIGSGAVFHYFMLRKFFFTSMSDAFIACEGGWGTRDELFEILTLMHTGKTPIAPVIYLSKDAHDFEQDLLKTAEKKFIHHDDLNLIDIVNTPDEAVAIIKKFYKNIFKVIYSQKNVIKLKFRKIPGENFRNYFKEIWKEDGKNFYDYQWKEVDRTLNLIKFRGRSYGQMRCFLEKINEVPL
jgi:uncharacterized protein (TIGR00730 family)